MFQTKSNERTAENQNPEIRPFSVHIPEAALVDLRRRILGDALA